MGAILTPPLPFPTSGNVSLFPDPAAAAVVFGAKDLTLALLGDVPAPDLEVARLTPAGALPLLLDAEVVRTREDGLECMCDATSWYVY